MLSAGMAGQWLALGIGVVVLASGCTGFSPRPRAPWDVRNPTPLPESKPLPLDPSGSAPAGAPSSTGDLEMFEPGDFQPGNEGSVDAFKSPDIPVPIEVPRTSKPAGEESRGGPQIVPQEVDVPTRLDLEVRVAPRKQVGSGAVFQLTVRNSGGQPADEVVVESEFDSALYFPGQKTRKVRQSLGTLVAGESKEIALTLASDEVGQHCCRFAVTSNGTEAIWKSVCVEYLTKSLDLQVLGPAQRTVGSRAEFTVKLVNTSTRDLHGIHAVLGHDIVLIPREASTGAVRGADQLTWDFADLKAGEGVQLQVEFECRLSAEHACLQIDVTGDGIPHEHAETCLQVQSIKGILDIQVDDRQDPIRIGDETEYVTTIRNRGLQPVRDVTVRGLVPSNMRVVGVQVSQEGQPFDVQSNVLGRELDIEGINLLPADAELSVAIQVKALRSGDEEFRVSVGHAASTDAVEVAEFTTVNP